MPSPEHEQIVALLRSMADPTAPVTVEGIRAAMDGVAAQFPAPPDTVVTETELGGVAVERIEAAGTPAGAPTVLNIHGGGYIAGSIAFGRGMCARLSGTAGVSVVSVDYRMAPEHAFPAALDDVRAAYGALLEQGVEPGRLVLFGDSAGAGLAVALLLALREAGEALPAGAVLLSPWVDLALTGGSIDGKAAEDPILTRAFLELGASSYAGDRLDDPLVSPLGADLAGLPPLQIQAGTADILVDDAVRLAERARAAGVDVDLHVAEGLIHVWPVFSHLPEAGEAVALMGDWVRRRVGG